MADFATSPTLALIRTTRLLAYHLPDDANRSPNQNGYPYQTSWLKLRRPGVWSEHELREIRDIAKEQADFFKGIY